MGRWWPVLADPGVVKKWPFSLVSSVIVAARLGWDGVGVLDAGAAALVVVAVVLVGGVRGLGVVWLPCHGHGGGVLVRLRQPVAVVRRAVASCTPFG